jgi:hypothetical protein
VCQKRVTKAKYYTKNHFHITSGLKCIGLGPLIGLINHIAFPYNKRRYLGLAIGRFMSKYLFIYFRKKRVWQVYVKIFNYSRKKQVWQIYVKIFIYLRKKQVWKVYVYLFIYLKNKQVLAIPN